MGLRPTLRLRERSSEHASAVLEESAVDVRGAFLYTPELRLCRLCFALCSFEGTARLSRYARRGRRGGIQSGKGLRRIADFDFGGEFLLEGADAGI